MGKYRMRMIIFTFFLPICFKKKKESCLTFEIDELPRTIHLRIHFQLSHTSVLTMQMVHEPWPLTQRSNFSVVPPLIPLIASPMKDYSNILPP
mmetsp:Transcript_32570/g.74943  ORF Transcript_32570/g.74943 Transcript_32570/m.74943 type:complete len:93 (-) Transcript_32570:93-371(-)